MCYPLLITAAGILVCLLTTLLATDFRPARAVDEIESTLKNQLIVSTVIMTPVCFYRALSRPANRPLSILLVGDPVGSCACCFAGTARLVISVAMAGAGRVPDLLLRTAG